MSWIWHWTIWWLGSSNAGAFGMQNTSTLPSLPCQLWPRVAALDRVLSVGQIELNCVLMLNWIVWNRTVLTFNCVWINDWYLIEILVIHSNTWNHLTLMTEENSLNILTVFLFYILTLDWAVNHEMHLCK